MLSPVQDLVPYVKPILFFPTLPGRGAALPTPTAPCNPISCHRQSLSLQSALVLKYLMKFQKERFLWRHRISEKTVASTLSLCVLNRNGVTTAVSFRDRDSAGDQYPVAAAHKIHLLRKRVAVYMELAMALQYGTCGKNKNQHTP